MAKKEEKTEEEVAEVEQKPNIASIGEGEPFKFFNTALGRVSLPADQSKPFYHEQANLIIQTWPDRYKPVVDKGA